MPEKEIWEKKIDNAIDIALKASQGVGKEHKLIVFEVVLRKMLDQAFAVKFP